MNVCTYLLTYVLLLLNLTVLLEYFNLKNFVPIF